MLYNPTGTVAAAAAALGADGAERRDLPLRVQAEFVSQNGGHAERDLSLVAFTAPAAFAGAKGRPNIFET
jgi:hypothetical protein